MIRPSNSSFPTPPSTPSTPAPLPCRILLVDDDPIILDAMARYLSSPTGGGYQVDTAPDGSEALAMLAGVGRPHTAPPTPATFPAPPTGSGGYQLVITDVNMPRTDGLELLRAIRQNHPEIVVLICTGYGTIENAVEAIKLGAFDYLTKPVIDDGLKVAVERALRQQMLMSENQNLRRQLDLRFGLENIVGHDHKMLKLFDLVEAVADSKTTVLISGESGTGKSLVARALHHRSGRRDQPFIEVSCGAIPETLLESELFGHVKGAFTGATGDKEGRFRAAEGGTIFLDEINSASPAFQVKLL
ncbi:MAG: sigma 54-interacting transcriptional regulator, partial [Phycisphaerae bacterium]